MTVSLGSSLDSEGICLFVDLWEAQPCLGDPEWDSSLLNYPVRDDESILTWLYPTFSIMLSAARLPQVRAEACISLQASWEWSKVWTVQTIFGELKVQLRNES